MRAMVACRTGALGGHLSRCDFCNYELISYNPCRNRHCPKCQALQKERWISARQAELLHMVLRIKRKWPVNPYADILPKLPAEIYLSQPYKKEFL
jgi:hypothetical protein